MTCVASPLVVKIGGSLLDRAPELASLFAEASRPLLIVPGGGRFADAVRTIDPPEEAAHWMAVAAMEQTGWYLTGLGLPGTDRLAVPDQTAVLLPYAAMRMHDPLPHSWSVTSDTIAAWVAATLRLELVLLKSVDGIFHEGGLVERVTAPVPCDEVDPLFLGYALGHGVRVTIVNGRKPERVRAALAGGPATGTVVDPRY